MQQLIKFEGSCCIYKYIKDTSDKTAQEIADHLGVDVLTIARWRKRVASGDVGCGYGASGKDGCENK